MKYLVRYISFALRNKDVLYPAAHWVNNYGDYNQKPVGWL